jgi:hypothetical protein
VTDTNAAVERLRQLLALVAREEFHLLGVRERLFGGLPDAQLTEAWLRHTLTTPEGIDRLESFGAKFGRMQDTLIDKLLPALLRASAEQPGSALDNLHRAERLGLLQHADDWPAMRLVHNRLVHEYFERPEAMLPALRSARHFVDTLCAAHGAMRAYAQSRFGD